MYRVVGVLQLGLLQLAVSHILSHPQCMKKEGQRHAEQRRELQVSRLPRARIIAQI